MNLRLAILLSILAVSALCQTSSSKTQTLESKRKRWVYFDQPISLKAFTYKTYNQVVIPFGHAVPANTPVIKAKLILFLRTGHQHNTQFWTKTSVIDGKGDDRDELVHWTYGHRYPQKAISYNSETIQIPCMTTRQIRVKSNHIQPTNCHLMQYFISGYLPA